MSWEKRKSKCMTQGKKKIPQENLLLMLQLRLFCFKRCFFLSLKRIMELYLYFLFLLNSLIFRVHASSLLNFCLTQLLSFSFRSNAWTSLDPNDHLSFLSLLFIHSFQLLSFHSFILFFIYITYFLHFHSFSQMHVIEHKRVPVLDTFYSSLFLFCLSCIVGKGVKEL